jgi:hypothetical protein
MAPGYLDQEADFKIYFQDPIEQGTYQESTGHVFRKPIIKLAVLRSIISPKHF